MALKETHILKQGAILFGVKPPKNWKKPVSPAGTQEDLPKAPPVPEKDEQAPPSSQD